MALVIAAEPVPLETDTEGVVRVGRTRVTLDTVIDAFLHGETAEEIAQQYPSLRLADIYAVIAFYLRRRSEVDSYLHERQRRANTVRTENEGRFDPSGLRDRLLARHADRVNDQCSVLLLTRTSTTISSAPCCDGSQILTLCEFKMLHFPESMKLPSWSGVRRKVGFSYARCDHNYALCIDRVRTGKTRPGVFEVGRGLANGLVIEDLLLLAERSLEREWEGQIRYLPLR